MKNTYRVLVGRPGGRRPLGRYRRRWEIILKGTSKNWDGREFTGSFWLKIEAGGVLL
jgi:hypothetical protein